MNRILLSILTVFLIGLYSCSNQETSVCDYSANSSFLISAEIPESIEQHNSRSVVSVPAGYQLRSIVEVWTKGEGALRRYREEKLFQTGTVPEFKFNLEAGDYDVLMWVDIVKDDTQKSEITDEYEISYEHYKDNVYKTIPDLRSVSVDDLSNMFDNTLCEAYFANDEVKKNEVSVNRKMKLERPYAKLVIKEKDMQKLSTLTHMKVGYEIPYVFNVLESQYTDVKYFTYEKDFVFNEESETKDVLFSSYLLGVTDRESSLSSMLFTFTTTEGVTSCEVKEGSIKYSCNKIINASGELIGAGTLEPEEPEEQENPKVGDFFFKDGTWGAELTEDNKENCIGIVYSVGAYEGDDVSNYPESDGKKILGYVMALNNIKLSASLLPKFEDPRYCLNKSRPYFYRQNESVNGRDETVDLLTKNKGFTWKDFSGYKSTENILKNSAYSTSDDKMAYPVLYVFDQWKQTEVIPCENASEWYIPSSGQLYEASMKCFSDTYTLKDTDIEKGAYDLGKDGELLAALNKAIDMGIATTFCGSTSVTGYYIWTSTLNSDGMSMAIQIGANQITNLNSNPNYKTQGIIRPFLTILK